jgi:drug/metabolite transporter (DMT)-like permease
MRSGRSEFSVGDATILLVLAGIWGFTFLFIKVAVAELTPLWLVSVRTFAGFLVLLVGGRIRHIALPHGIAMWFHIAILAVPANVVPWALVAVAQKTITSGLTAVLYSLIPIMTLIISAAMSTEKLSLQKAVGLLTALAGTIVVVGYDFESRGHATATIIVLVACALLAGGAVYAKRFVTPHVQALPMATVQIGIAFAASTVIALLIDDAPRWGQLSMSVIAAAATLGVLGTGLAFLLYYILIDRVGATNANLVTYLMPAIGLTAGWMFLGEPVQPSLLVGCAVIVAGVWLAQRTGRTAPPNSTLP